MAYSFAVTFSRTLFHDPTLNFHRHSQSFANRPISPTLLVPFPGLYAHGLEVRHWVNNLGCNFLLENHPALMCPEAIRMFFSNLRYFGLQSRTLTTLVFSHLLTLPADDIGRLLGFPAVGENLAHESELPLLNFNIAEEVV
ncbi:unnamed protein product [Linum trigynum]|uniref:Uncharacterized protein n=1 Tax=Linum trigynum TaxID=586398 RepID=A0AAV2ED36_9ROSI